MRVREANEFIDKYKKNDKQNDKQNDMITDFLSILSTNIDRNLKDNFTSKDYDNAIELYNIYISICAFKDKNYLRLYNKINQAKKIYEDNKILKEYEEAVILSNEAAKKAAEEVSKNILLLITKNNFNNVFNSLQEKEKREAEAERLRKEA